MKDISFLSRIDFSVFNNVWHYGLVNISGNEIKIRNIIIALVILIVGIKLSKKLISLIIPVISKKLEDDQDLVYTIKCLLSVGFYGIIILLSLQIANIPLAIFAFIGGAFAISTGLGAQAFINNIINTIIIIVEKPIKIGDIIEIQGAIGRVKSIGTRFITLNSFTGEDILIPNAILVQNKFLKWSVNDNISCYMYVNIIKKNGLQLDHTLIVEQLNHVIRELDSTVPSTLVEIYLSKISELEDEFFVQFNYNLKLIKKTTFIKSKVNFILLKHLKVPFKVKYSENLG